MAAGEPGFNRDGGAAALDRSAPAAASQSARQSIRQQRANASADARGRARDGEDLSQASLGWEDGVAAGSSVNVSAEDASRRISTPETPSPAPRGPSAAV